MSIQNPDPEKSQEVREGGLASFSVLKKKTESQTWGRNGVKKPSLIVLGLSFLFTIFPHAWDSVFFQRAEIGKSSLSHFLKNFRTRVLYTH